MIKYLMAAVLFCGCTSNTERKVEDETKTLRVIYTDITWDLSVVEVDSCEYVMSRTTRGVSIVHKENCKNHIRFNNIDLRWDVDSTDIGAK